MGWGKHGRTFYFIQMQLYVYITVEAHAMARNGRFDREDLYQLRNSFVADEDLETSYC